MLSNFRKVKFEGILACPDCFSSVEYSDSNFICVGCGKYYLEQEGKIYFHGIGNNKLFSTEASGGKDSLLLFLKSFAKKWPSFFLLLYKIAAPFTGQTAEKFVEQCQDNDIILNIGSGSKVIGKDVLMKFCQAFVEILGVSN